MYGQGNKEHKRNCIIDFYIEEIETGDKKTALRYKYRMDKLLTMFSS